MIEINKEEAMAIRAKYPDVGITRTCKNKTKRHHYYVCELGRVMAIVNKMRRIDNGKEGEKNGYRKKTKRNRT